MAYDNLLTLVGDFIHAAEMWVYGEWNMEKVLRATPALFPIFTGGYGLYKAYRYAESRLSHRLFEFLEREEKRLTDVRKKLMLAHTKPSLQRPQFRSVFANKLLNNGLHQMRWGKNERAERSIEDALKLIDEQMTTAQKWQAAQQAQKAAAHLLLGAIADAKGEHDKALVHFQSALDQNSEDVEALEYAGLQLLRNANPQQAFQYFEDLENKAKVLQDDLLASRSRKLQAEALCQFPQPRYAVANQLLLQIVNSFPREMPPFDRAIIHIQHGNVRQKLGFNNVSLASFQTAKNILAVLKEQEIPDAADAKVAFETVSAKIFELNRTPQSDATDNPPAPLTFAPA